MTKVLPKVGLLAAASILAWSMTAETGEPRERAAAELSEIAGDQPVRGHGPFDYASTSRRGWRGQGDAPAYWPAR